MSIGGGRELRRCAIVLTSSRQLGGGQGFLSNPQLRQTHDHRLLSRFVIARDGLRYFTPERNQHANREEPMDALKTTKITNFPGSTKLRLKLRSYDRSYEIFTAWAVFNGCTPDLRTIPLAHHAQLTAVCSGAGRGAHKSASAVADCPGASEEDGKSIPTSGGRAPRPGITSWSSGICERRRR